MKNFEIKISVKNNNLKQRRDELGFTAKKMAKEIGIHKIIYGRFENMKESPFRSYDAKALPGELKESAKKILDYFYADVEDIWPECVLKIKKPTATIKANDDDVVRLTTGRSRRELMSPEDAVIEKENVSRMLNAVKVLNDTEKDVIKQSLIGYNNREIGERLCRSGSRVQQIVSSVPYKIRNEIREIEEEARKK